MLLTFADTLSVGASVALLLVGIVVLLRAPRARGNILFCLISTSLAYWTSIDWFLGVPSFSPAARIALKIAFYLTVCAGPALAAHAGAYLARRHFTRAGFFFYAAAFLSFVFLTAGLLARTLPIPFESSTLLLGGALLALLATAASLVSVAIELYPALSAHASGVLERRRAAYGLLLFVPFLLAGGLELVVGPIPVNVLLPLLALAFLAFSLLAFIRASLLDVDLSPLEAFYLFLLTFALLLLLRATSGEDLVTIAIGAAVVGAFGAYAVRMYRGERRRRLGAEAVTRELQRLDRAKSDFVDMAAHQLRGPLGAIRGASEMLADGDYGGIGDTAKKVSARIQNTATRLLSLAETFLNVSQVELGSYTSERVPTDVTAEVALILAEMSQIAEEKGILLRSECRAAIPQRVRLDRTVFQNALYNLVDNALKYTARGSVTVRCSLRDRILSIEVADTGEGMGHDEIAELFKKFHRGSAAHSREIDGSGLGLYVVRQLATAAGGSVTAESGGKGKGSTFTLRLPAS